MNTVTLVRFSKTLARATVLPVALMMFMPATGVVSQAQAWWSCPAGYSLQTRNNATSVRCYRAGSESRVSPDAGCPVGTTYNRDHRGNSDYCLPVGGTVVGRAFAAKCGPGQRKDIRSGADHCYKTTPGHERPVDRNV